MKNGAIYIIINRSFPGLVKVGFSVDVEKMMEQLNNGTMTPYPYMIYAKYEVPSTSAEEGVQRIIHRLMQGKEIDDEQKKLQERGFYALKPDAVYEYLEDLAIIHGRPDQLHKYPEAEDVLKDIEERERVREIEEAMRRENRERQRRYSNATPMRKRQFRFSMIGLKPGDMIQFKNDQSQSFKILNDKEVEFEGKPYSLTALAMKLAGKALGVQGTLYFTYNGEVLDKIRKRMEREE